MDNYISVQSSQDVIQHFGTKGMKWGQRAAKKISSGIDRFMGGVDHRYAKAAKAYNDYVNK